MNDSPGSPAGDRTPPPGGQGDLGTGADQARRFGFELRQKSVDALAAEFRKLALLGSALLGIFSWPVSPVVAVVATAIVWILVQIVAMAIETIRVYPSQKGTSKDQEVIHERDS